MKKQMKGRLTIAQDVLRINKALSHLIDIEVAGPISIRHLCSGRAPVINCRYYYYQ